MKGMIVDMAVVACLLAAGEVLAGEPDKTELMCLGQELVDAIKNDNFAAYAQCWASGAVLCEDFAEIHDDPEEDLGEMKAYYVKRDRKIAAFYRALQDELVGLVGKRSGLALDSVSAEGFREEHLIDKKTLQVVGQLIVTIRAGTNTLVRLDMDDGIRIGRKWYFSDSPRRHVAVVTIKNGREHKSRTIELNVSTPTDTAHSPYDGKEVDYSRELNLLGKQFVRSLKEDNVIEFCQCWMPSSRLPEVLVRLDTTTEEEVEEAKALLLKGYEEIPACFEELRDQLGELAADPSRISYEAILRGGGMRSRDEPRLVTSRSISILIRVNAETLVTVRIDGAVLLGDHWYLCGRLQPKIALVEKAKGNSEEERKSILQLKGVSEKMKDE